MSQKLDFLRLYMSFKLIISSLSKVKKCELLAQLRPTGVKLMTSIALQSQKMAAICILHELIK